MRLVSKMARNNLTGKNTSEKKGPLADAFGFLGQALNVARGLSNIDENGLRNINNILKVNSEQLMNALGSRPRDSKSVQEIINAMPDSGSLSDKFIRNLAHAVMLDASDKFPGMALGSAVGVKIALVGMREIESSIDTENVHKLIEGLKILSMGFRMLNDELNENILDPVVQTAQVTSAPSHKRKHFKSILKRKRALQRKLAAGVTPRERELLKERIGRLARAAELERQKAALRKKIRTGMDALHEVRRMTEDRWRWRRFFKPIHLVIIAIMLCASLAMGLVGIGIGLHIAQSESANAMKCVAVGNEQFKCSPAASEGKAAHPVTGEPAK